MFSKIPEISLNSVQTSNQSATGSNEGARKPQSPQTKQGSSQQSKPASHQQAKPGSNRQSNTGQQTKPGSPQQTKPVAIRQPRPRTVQQNVGAQKDLPETPPKVEDKNISKPANSALAPNSGSSKPTSVKLKASFEETNTAPKDVVGELDAGAKVGLDGQIVQARRFSGGRSKSPEISAPVMELSTRHFSITSLPSSEQPQARRPSISKAASAVSTSERLTDQFLRRMSITSSHSGERSVERRLSGSSPKSSTEVAQDEARRIGMDANQQRRRSSREGRRRASLILVGSNYRVGRKLGAGNFGEIRIGKNMATDEIVAIKLEPMSARFCQLRREYILYKKLGQPAVEGIPSVYFWSTCLSYNALVMELLGPNLAELFELCDQKFTLKTVVLIALQTIRRIQFVHSKSILYRDVKPENFVIGRLESKRQIIYLLDFGLAKEYIDPETQEHIPFKENKGITGTARYISVNMHQGKEMSRRDDLEALGYMLVYFLKGRLPWQGQHLCNDMETLKAVSNIKIRTTIEQLCAGHPHEFSIYLHYVRALGFFDSPDYDFLSNLFHGLLKKRNLQCDWKFDWMEHTLHVTTSGILVTKLPDTTKPDLIEEPFVDHASSGEGIRFQSNKAMMSYDNLLLRDLSPNVSAEAILEGGPEMFPATGGDSSKDKTLSLQTPYCTKCIFCQCCGVCCLHSTTASSNKVSVV